MNTVECVCCGTVGIRAARGLIRSCYVRAYNAQTLDRWPSQRRRGPRRQGASVRARRDAYLACRDAGMKQAPAAEHAGVSIRTATRYESDRAMGVA